MPRGRPKGFRPPNAGIGRKPGPNKITRDVKEMVLRALNGVGGQDYLETQALANPVAFMSLVGRIIPQQVGSDPANPLKVEMSIEDRRAIAMREIEEAFAEGPRLVIERLLENG